MESLRYEKMNPEYCRGNSESLPVLKPRKAVLHVNIDQSNAQGNVRLLKQLTDLSSDDEKIPYHMYRSKAGTPLTTFGSTVKRQDLLSKTTFKPASELIEVKGLVAPREESAAQAPVTVEFTDVAEEDIDQEVSNTESTILEDGTFQGIVHHPESLAYIDIAEYQIKQVYGEILERQYQTLTEQPFNGPNHLVALTIIGGESVLCHIRLARISEFKMNYEDIVFRLKESALLTIKWNVENIEKEQQCTAISIPSSMVEYYGHIVLAVQEKSAKQFKNMATTHPALNRSTLIWHIAHVEILSQNAGIKRGVAALNS
ncbi:MAG: hypothetical protein MMC33_005838 [Icmadophila ericetorum]|nr:hypothetical protein [Icmadophila ericetorum]